MTLTTDQTNILQQQIDSLVQEQTTTTTLISTMNKNAEQLTIKLNDINSQINILQAVLNS